ncbi:MAG: hypothetical protein ACR2L2_14395 [Acidobacteriota bacterium]
MTPEERFKRIDRNLEFLGQFLLRTARMLEGFARRTEARFDGVEQSLQRLAEAGARTDERLNVLVHVVERHFSSGPNR